MVTTFKDTLAGIDFSVVGNSTSNPLWPVSFGLSYLFLLSFLKRPSPLHQP
jgi:hypothetical protein